MYYNSLGSWVSIITVEVHHPKKTRTTTVSRHWAALKQQEKSKTLWTQVLPTFYTELNWIDTGNGKNTHEKAFSCLFLFNCSSLIKRGHSTLIFKLQQQQQQNFDILAGWCQWNKKILSKDKHEKTEHYKIFFWQMMLSSHFIFKDAIYCIFSSCKNGFGNSVDFS